VLSPNVLNRASDAYRRGYMDGYYNDLNMSAHYGEFSFGRTDYNSGYATGKNDAAHSMSRILHIRDRIAENADDRYAAECYADADAINYGTR